MQKHSKQPIPCEVSEAEATDGYNKEQEKQLRGRKRPANQTDEQRWYDMYTILFPKDPPLLVPSPYYESQEMQIQGQLVKFKDYLKDELPKKMWTDLQSDLQPLSDAEMINMQKRIEEMVHECTDGFFLQCQRSFLSPPSTPLPSEPQRRIPSSPLQSDSLSEDSGMSNQLIPLATAVPANPTRTGISDLEFEEMLPSRDGSGYIQPPVPTAFTAYTASPIVPAPTAFTANITYPARPSTPDSNRRRGFTNQSIWNPPYLASSDPVMGQYGTMNSGDDGANLDFDQIMFSMGPMDSGHWIQPPASGYS
ncbi:hypothetical protein P154DRAFT_337021 [Amniculicola lignicola CBS 123094]|uniref:Uncharacterized protein n=1 Tax=Amniculicola lignicola CBS 123094 TaxID=1392246 RepID=A0A6A5WU82_9PLEO|nr:hypothetical protein P154DRAFT_337021 [Amniculicola lignicola CBS 123094]